MPAVHTTTRNMLDPLYWLGNFAAYRNAGGIILADLETGCSVFFQPGDDAFAFEDRADEIMGHRRWGESRIETAWNNFCNDYVDVMDTPEQAGGRPSSDGGFFYFFNV